MTANIDLDQVEAAVKTYPYPDRYRSWPGPNSNTFLAHIGRAVPELRLDRLDARPVVPAGRRLDQMPAQPIAQGAKAILLMQATAVWGKPELGKIASSWSALREVSGMWSARNLSSRSP